MQLFFFKNMEMYMEWLREDHTQEAHPSRGNRRRIHHENTPISFDPLKPHFYTEKLGFTGDTLIFLFLLKV